MPAARAAAATVCTLHCDCDARATAPARPASRRSPAPRPAPVGSVSRPAPPRASRDPVAVRLLYASYIIIPMYPAAERLRSMTVFGLCTSYTTRQSSHCRPGTRATVGPGDKAYASGADDSTLQHLASLFASPWYDISLVVTQHADHPRGGKRSHSRRARPRVLTGCR